MPPCDELHHAPTPAARLRDELGRIVARLADEPDPAARTDLADQAYDVLAVLERLEGARHLAHPRGLRLVS